MALLAAVVVWFRLPVLINARAVHSDGALVALQARHILKGEWSWFLWGVGYQASFDSAMTALAFGVFGASPRVLLLMPLVAHLLLMGMAYHLLLKRVGPWSAFVLLLALAWVPGLLGVSPYPPRHWSITLVVAGIWLLDGAGESRWPRLRSAAGALLGVVSLYLDLYCLQFMAGFGLFALACGLEMRAGQLAPAPRRIGAAVLGAVLGGLLVLLLRHRPEASAWIAGFRIDRLAFNLRLLFETCLPAFLGAKIFLPVGKPVAELWHPPLLFQILQGLGTLGLLAGMAASLAFALQRRTPWELRRLGLLGGLVSLSSLGAFAVSIMPIDRWATRYLAPIAYLAPFTLAPLASRLGARRLCLGLLPYLVTTATGAWLMFGPSVHGPLPILDASGIAAEESRLCHALRQLGIRYGAAPYWLSYRLTFLCEEDPVLVPLAEPEDRHAPYRLAYKAAPLVALVFHPSAPQTTPEEIESQLRSWRAAYVRAQIAGYTVLIWQRAPLGRDRAGPGAAAGSAAARARSP
jgi:hypothetical protein